MNLPSVDVFQALADPTRRNILQMLMNGEKSIRTIAEVFPQNRNAIVKHLGILKSAALVEARPVGRETLHRILPGPLDEVRKWLTYFDAFWDEKLANLKAIAEATSPSNHQSGADKRLSKKRSKIRAISSETIPLGWLVYVLECGDKTLYTGITNDFARRFDAHKSGKGARYTRSRGPLRCVYFEVAESKGHALKREAAMKKLSRSEKMKLIRGQ